MEGGKKGGTMQTIMLHPTLVQRADDSTETRRYKDELQQLLTAVCDGPSGVVDSITMARLTKEVASCLDEAHAVADANQCASDTRQPKRMAVVKPKLDDKQAIHFLQSERTALRLLESNSIIGKRECKQALDRIQKTLEATRENCAANAGVSELHNVVSASYQDVCRVYDNKG